MSTYICKIPWRHRMQNRILYVCVVWRTAIGWTKCICWVLRACYICNQTNIWINDISHSTWPLYSWYQISLKWFHQPIIEYPPYWTSKMNSDSLIHSTTMVSSKFHIGVNGCRPQKLDKFTCALNHLQQNKHIYMSYTCIYICEGFLK
jgi:hypothetical protein